MGWELVSAGLGELSQRLYGEEFKERSGAYPRRKFQVYRGKSKIEERSRVLWWVRMLELLRIQFPLIPIHERSADLFPSKNKQGSCGPLKMNLYMSISIVNLQGATKRQTDRVRMSFLEPTSRIQTVAVQSYQFTLEKWHFPQKQLIGFRHI